MNALDLPSPELRGPASFPGSAPQEDWPYDALQVFALKMANNGLSVSSRLMAGNRSYALQQLREAHAMADPELRELAVALFRHFERQRSGISV